MTKELVNAGESIVAVALVAAGKSIPVALKIARELDDKWGNRKALRMDLPLLLADLQNAIADPKMYG